MKKEDLIKGFFANSNDNRSINPVSRCEFFKDGAVKIELTVFTAYVGENCKAPVSYITFTDVASGKEITSSIIAVIKSYNGDLFTSKLPECLAAVALLHKIEEMNMNFDADNEVILNNMWNDVKEITKQKGY